MITNFFIALLLFFNINLGHVNNDKPNNKPPKQETTEKSIINDDIKL